MTLCACTAHTVPVGVVRLIQDGHHTTTWCSPAPGQLDGPADLAPQPTATGPTLHASAVVTLHAAAMVVDDVSTDARVVSGVLVPYGGEVGFTSAGAVTASQGAIQLPSPDQLRRIKLMDEHQDPPVAIGYMTAVRDTPEGLRGSFHVAATPDGERALLELSEGVRDGFSVELTDVRLSETGELVSARLSAVAFVAVPAWASARQDGLAASTTSTTTTTTTTGTTTTKGTTTMLTEAQRARLNELLAATDRSTAEDQELAQLLELARPTDATDQADDADQAADQPVAVQAAAVRVSRSAPAALPAGLQGRPQRRPGPDLRDLYASTARVLSGQSRPELEAALSDVTSTANIWTAGDDYAGQLWSGLTYVRRYVPLMASGELRSYKGTGWRWGVKPEVADYAGDKAAVPSNAPTTQDSSWTAARLAGAHDLDRKFVDFGDAEFIAAYYEAMRESYAMKSDDKARAFIIANATAAGAAGAGLFRAAAVAAQAVEDNTGGVQADYFLINSTDRLGLLNVTSGNLPAYLEAFGVTPDKFMAAPGVPAGTVIAGTRQAARFRELAGSPIRVEAINIANGGIDGGVFGYYATELLHAGGIQAATFTP